MSRISKEKPEIQKGTSGLFIAFIDLRAHYPVDTLGIYYQPMAESSPSLNHTLMNLFCQKTAISKEKRSQDTRALTLSNYRISIIPEKTKREED